MAYEDDFLREVWFQLRLMRSKYFHCSSDYDALGGLMYKVSTAQITGDLTWDIEFRRYCVDRCGR